MARAVAAQPLFSAFAGVAGYYAQATGQSTNTRAISRAREAEKRWRETGIEETVPAVAADNGDVAMPLAEAFSYYGTARGAVPNYTNAFAVQSWAYTSIFDAIGAAKLIRVPTMVIHSERALAPSLARRFQADLNNARVLWVESLDRSISMTIVTSLRSGRMPRPDFLRRRVRFNPPALSAACATRLDEIHCQIAFPKAERSMKSEKCG